MTLNGQSAAPCSWCGGVWVARDMAGVTCTVCRTSVGLCPPCWWKWRDEPGYCRCPMTPADAIDRTISVIVGSWDRWEGEAGQAGQREQHPDAYADTLAGFLREELERLVGAVRR